MQSVRCGNWPMPLSCKALFSAFRRRNTEQPQPALPTKKGSPRESLRKEVTPSAAFEGNVIDYAE